MNSHVRRLLVFLTMLSVPTVQAQQRPDLIDQRQLRIKERGLHHRVWEWTEHEDTPSGPIPRTRSYTELATGMHYRDERGQWQESRERIEVLPNGAGASAGHGQHKVIFPPAIESGPIQLHLPDSRWLRSQVLGLAYFDTSTGKSALIAELKGGEGVIHGDNVVVYADCFEADGFKASLRYTYTLSGFEQDVVLHEQPPSPEEYGLNPATTRLQVLTEFLNPPKPVQKPDNFRSPTGAWVRDQKLVFGDMTIGRGRAFSTDDPQRDIPVEKLWQRIDGRDILIEEVPVPNVQSELQMLPKGASFKSQPGARTASMERVLPTRKLAGGSPVKMRIAQLTAAPLKGFVLDYVTGLTSETNYVFNGYDTYYISGNVSLWGDQTTFEGGTVIKFASNVSLLVNTPVKWLGKSYNPVIMVSKDDNRVGENISGSTGLPGNTHYANRALYLDASVSGSDYALSHLRIANAQTAVAINGGSVHSLTNVQLLNCRVGLAATNSTVRLQNALMARVLTNFTGSSCVAEVEHLTSDVAAWLSRDLGANLFITNSVLAAVTNTGSYSGEAVSVVSSGTGVFQTVGAADHYLVAGSTNRNSGTTNLGAELLKELRSKTTYPPIVYSNTTLASAMTFNPVIQRDTDIPDRGYHYDTLDYVFGGVTLGTNATFNAGTVIGWFELPGSGGPGYGLSVPNGARVAFNGMATAPCIMARYSTVQEGTNSLWKDKGWLAGIRGTGSFQPTQPAEIHATFLHSYLPAAGPCHFRDYNNMLRVSGNHCEFYNGNQGGYNTQSAYTNCLFSRVYLVNSTSQSTARFILRNCTHYGGTVHFAHGESSAPYWYSSIMECAFDNTAFNMNDPSSGNQSYVTNGFNAYIQGAQVTNPAGGNNFTNTTFDWQNGAFGRFYYPTDSTLVDVGSVPADAVGLYHFTTDTSQTSGEGNSAVNLGYHYVASDGYGIPWDTDNDGSPDYVEDRNGNGLADSGETRRDSALDTGLKVLITRPRHGIQ